MAVLFARSFMILSLGDCNPIGEDEYDGWMRANLGRGPDATIQVQKAARLTALGRNCVDGIAKQSTEFKGYT